MQRIPYITRYQIALYREAPGNRTDRNEFYNINVEPLYVRGELQPGKWIVMERHGWWDDQAQSPKELAQTFGPDDPLHAYDDIMAIAEAKRQTGRRAAEGFRYACQIDPTKPEGLIQFLVNESGDLRLI